MCTPNTWIVRLRVLVGQIFVTINHYIRVKALKINIVQSKFWTQRPRILAQEINILLIYVLPAQERWASGMPSI